MSTRTAARTDQGGGMAAATQARASGDAAEFVEFFAAGWALGARGDFFAHFLPRVHADAVFEQPLARAAHGPDGLRELFEPLFEAIPDLHGEVVRWGATSDGVIVELDLRGSMGGKPLAWTTLDRIVLEDGLILSRKAHFDPLPLVAQLLGHPIATARLLPALLRRRAGG